MENLKGEGNFSEIERVRKHGNANAGSQNEVAGQGREEGPWRGIGMNKRVEMGREEEDRREWRCCDLAVAAA